MGMGDIFNEFAEQYKKVNSHFNPIGKCYLKFMLLCRVLVVGVFLDDLFDEPELTCETDQVGCETTCVNRFAPISHLQVWQAELMVVFLSIFVFLAFNIMNQKAFNSYKKKLDLNPNTEKYLKAGFYDVDNPDAQQADLDNVNLINIRSNITTTGYIFMLCFRLAMEILFLVIEASLAKHHSQNSTFDQFFYLKEKWLCPTNDNDPAKIRSTNELLPFSNRSAFFHRLDTNFACVQQQVTVTCWIPYSRMKSLGMQFMYTVLVLQCVMTLMELILEMINVCRRKAKINSMQLKYRKSMSVRVRQQQSQKDVNVTAVTHS